MAYFYLFHSKHKAEKAADIKGEMISIYVEGELDVEGIRILFENAAFAFSKKLKLKNDGKTKPNKYK